MVFATANDGVARTAVTGSLWRGHVVVASWGHPSCCEQQRRMAVRAEIDLRVWPGVHPV